mgnify:FL=1
MIIGVPYNALSTYMYMISCSTIVLTYGGLDTGLGGHFIKSPRTDVSTR